jgi:hypothetical protein
MFGKKKLGLSDELWKKIEDASQVAMCSSTEEWAIQILQEAADKVLRDAGKQDLSQADVDDITKKLQGLGYLE